MRFFRFVRARLSILRIGKTERGPIVMSQEQEESGSLTPRSPSNTDIELRRTHTHVAAQIILQQPSPVPPTAETAAALEANIKGLIQSEGKSDFSGFS